MSTTSSPDDEVALLRGSQQHALSESRKEWEEDAETDKFDREAIKQRIHNPGPYTAEENACFEVALQREKKVASGGAAQIRKIKSKYSLIRASTADADGILYGHVTCIVRAHVDDVRAFFRHDDSTICRK